MIFSKAVYGNVMPLPQRHQQKTKSKHRGCSLSASSLSICGWLGSPLLKVLPARGLSEPQVRTWKEEEGCLLGQPSSVHHLCRKGLIKRCGEQTPSQRPTPASGQISGAEQDTQLPAPQPHPGQILGRCCPIHKCFKIFTVLRFYSAFSHYILNLDKLFCLFLHVAMFFIKGRHCYSW